MIWKQVTTILTNHTSNTVPKSTTTSMAVMKIVYVIYFKNMTLYKSNRFFQKNCDY